MTSLPAHPLILWPIFAMVLLTAITWVRLYFERIGEIRARRISPQRIASRQEAAQMLQHTRAADHLANQFEMPVLFYVLCICVAITDIEPAIFVAGAWLYVGLRALHAAIHLTYNRVLHRFMAYVASSLVLFALWVIFAWRLAQA
jgi:hypothetical protein